jgi:thiosulfate dehydrogenase [quinone] large subunit
MSEATEKKEVWSDATLAFLLLRLWLGMRAIVTGIEKFSTTVTEKKAAVSATGEQDIAGAMVLVKTKVYGLANYAAVKGALAKSLANEPLLPEFFRKPYYAVLGYALIVLGVMLILGLGTRTSLFLMGLLYISLTYGLILLGQDAGVAWLAIHVGLVAGALMLAKHNRLAIMKRF